MNVILLPKVRESWRSWCTACNLLATGAKLMRELATAALVGLIAVSGAQAGSKKNIADDLIQLDSLPVRVRYSATVNTLKPARDLLSVEGTTARFKLRQAGGRGAYTTVTVEIAGEGPGDTFVTTGTLKYEVLSHKERVAVRVTRQDGAPTATYIYDGRDSVMLSYVKGSARPAISEMKGQKFSLKYFSLSQYADMYVTALDELPDLVKSGNSYIDSVVEPSLEFVYDASGNLHEVNMPRAKRSTGYVYSLFSPVDRCALPTTAQYYERDADGADTLSIVYHEIAYSLLSEEAFESDFSGFALNENSQETAQQIVSNIIRRLRSSWKLSPTDVGMRFRNYNYQPHRSDDNTSQAAK